MSRQAPWISVAAAALLGILSGCQPQMPFYLKQPADGELSHYIGVATELEQPDVCTDRLADVSEAKAPLSLKNRENQQIWDLTLEEAIQTALKNNKVMRTIGGQVQGPPDFILRNPDLVPTIYDPALAESNPRTSAEAALSVFDVQASTSATWEKRDRPQNINAASAVFFPVVDEEDLGNFQAKLQKVTATGGTFAVTHNVDYALTNNPTRAYTADWNVNVIAEWRQPLLQGAGVQFNRIAGPGAQPGQFNGVVIARINTDIALANFEVGVRNLVSDVEIAYWELYYQYRLLDTAIFGRDSALDRWRNIHDRYVTGTIGTAEEAASRAQYYIYRDSTEKTLNALYVTEAKLRYLMGLAATDGRLIRPKEEPTTAKVSFDWHDVLCEGLARSVELRQQKWIVKRAELQLIASKNFLLPKLDFVAQYRWFGLGDRLDGANPLNPNSFLAGAPYPDSNAYRTLLDGNFQDWQLGIQSQWNIGSRREMAGVRNAQMALAKEQTLLQEGELELSHQLAYAIRDLETNFVLIQTAFSRGVAAKRQLDADQEIWNEGVGGIAILDTLFRAQQEFSDAQSNYYRTLVDYNRSISQVHYRKGSLLEYNGVYLAEGPWPGKAYFDARRRARARDAATYLDYGFTQPRVMSRGPIEQHADAGMPVEGGPADATPAPAQSEAVPTPEPQPAAGPAPPAPAEKEPPKPVPATPAPAETLPAEPALRPGPQASAADRTAPAFGVPASAGGRLKAELQTAADWQPARNADSQSAAQTPADRQVRPAGWTVVEKGSSYESGENPLPAPGWTGVQR